MNGKVRVGDVRHCFAHIGAAERLLGFRPRVELASGMRDLTAWLAAESPSDHTEAALRELETRDLAL